MATKDGFVYALREQNDNGFFVKLGRSNKVKTRTSSLNAGAKTKGEDLYIYRQLYVEDTVKAERSLHNLFAKYRIRDNREWFELDLEGIELLHLVFDTYDRNTTYHQLLRLRALGLRKGVYNEGD